MTEKAESILRRAAELVSGDRQATHGEPETNYENVAYLWTAWLEATGYVSGSDTLSARDTLVLMALLKVARTLSGAQNEDDYIDAAGYIALAGQIALAEDIIPHVAPQYGSRLRCVSEDFDNAC